MPIATYQTLLDRGQVWQAKHWTEPSGPVQSTGWPMLDAALPGHGWPCDGLIELIPERAGMGELQILMPLLANADGDCWIVWISPPWIPYAPALEANGIDLDRLLVVCPADTAQNLWACRSAIDSGACHAVVCWDPGFDHSALRKLQLSIGTALTPFFLYRPAITLRNPSPALLRLRLSPIEAGLGVHIIKRRGPPAAAMINLSVNRSCWGKSTTESAPHSSRKFPVPHALDCTLSSGPALAGVCANSA